MLSGPPRASPPSPLPSGAASVDAPAAAGPSGTAGSVDVSVLIVNYNTAHLLREMQEALVRSTQGLRLQTIVVDNASRDESVSILRRDFQKATLICNADNVGFGRANNQALSAGAVGRYVLLLNTDAFVAADTLRKTVAYLDGHPACGILGVRLVGRDGALQPSCRYFPTPWNVFLARTGLTRFFPKVRMVDDMNWDHASVRECDWVPGCYLLVRREVIDQVGLFDPRYFLYYEELDHCFAARKAGWKVVYFPDTEVVHIGGESAKSDSELTSGGRQIQVLQIESELLFFRKNHGLAGVLCSLVLSTLADVVLAAKHLLKGRPRRELSTHWLHVRAVWRSFVQTRWGTLPTR